MDRKEIIKALEEHTGVKAKYMGAPSFAYQIAIAEEIFTVDRAGKINTSAGVEVELQRMLNGAIGEEVSEMEKMDNETGPVEFEVRLPMEGHTGVTLRNLVNMIYSKQILIKKAFELEEDIVDAEFITSVNNARVETLEDFKIAIAENGARGCRGIEFNFMDNTIAFKFGRNLREANKLEAYTWFVSLLNKSAKSQKYASPKPTDTDNDKFTMRTWLIRLGFIGTEYKKAREILLKNLGGNGAFRKAKTSEDIIAQ